MAFIFQFVNVVYHSDRFANVEESLHPWDKAYLVIMYGLFTGVPLLCFTSGGAPAEPSLGCLLGASQGPAHMGAGILSLEPTEGHETSVWASSSWVLDPARSNPETCCVLCPISCCLLRKLAGLRN